VVLGYPETENCDVNQAASQKDLRRVEQQLQQVLDKLGDLEYVIGKRRDEDSALVDTLRGVASALDDIVRVLDEMSASKEAE